MLSKILKSSKSLLKHANYENFIIISLAIIILSFTLKANFSSIAIIIFIVISIKNFSIKNLKYNFINNIVFQVILAFFLLNCIGLFYTQDIDEGLFKIEKMLPFLVFPIFLGSIKVNIKKLIYKFYILYLGIITCFCTYLVSVKFIFFITNEVQIKNFFMWEYSYIFFTLPLSIHPTYFSLMVLFALFIIISCNLPNNFIIKYVVLTLLLFSLINCAVKMAVIALFISIIAYLFKRFNYKKSLIYSLLLLVILILVIYNTPVLYWRFFQEFKSIEASYLISRTTSYRYIQWLCSISIIKNHFFFGVGTGDFQEYLNICYASLNASHLKGYNSHNQYLDIFGRLGILGFIMLCLLFASLLYKSFQLKEIPLYLIFISFSLVSFTENIFGISIGVIFFNILAVLIINLSRENIQHSRNFKRENN